MKNQKTAAILGVVAALFVLAVAFYPDLLPICQAAGFCNELTAAVE